MKSILIAVLLSASTLPLIAQVPDIQWQKTYGTTANESFNQITKTLDGNYMVCGKAGPAISGDKTVAGAIWLLKLDTLGNILSQYGYATIEGRNVNIIRQIRPTRDSGVVIIADVQGVGGENEDFGILKLDKNGVVQFEQQIEGNLSDIPMSVCQTLDNGYVLVGGSESNAGLDKTENAVGLGDDVWAVKLDSTGAIQWQNTIGGSANDYGCYVYQYQDSSFVLVATSLSDISGDKIFNTNGGYDIWLLKLDANGNLLTQNQFGGIADDISWNAISFPNKEVYISTYSTSGISGNKIEMNYGFSDYWIFKIDSTGTILWQNTIGGSSQDITMGIDVNGSGETFIAGRSNSPMSGEKSENSMGGYDYWIVKLNAAGALEWENTIGGSGIEDCRSIIANSDGSCIVAGISNSPISGDKSQASVGAADFWIVKIEGSGNAPLPLDFIAFTGTLQNNAAQLQWETANKINVSKFEIEESSDALSFTKIGSLAATEKEQYGFTDTHLFDRNNYYRIKVIDLDQQVSYSKTILLIHSDRIEISLFPNPVKDELYIATSAKDFRYQITDLYGRKWISGISATSQTPISCAQLPQGIYQVRLEMGQEIRNLKFLHE